MGARLSAGLRSVCVARSACLSFVILLCIVSWPAAGDNQRRRIYFLESLAPTQPAAIRTVEAFKKRLSEITSESFEIFIDYMDLARFPGQAHLDRTVRFLAEKYAEAPPDLLIPLGRAAVPFMLQHSDVLAPQAPIIMANVPARTAAEAKTLANAVWVVTEYNFSKTLELAQRLQPEARDLVFVAGASEYDRSWVTDARRELEPYLSRYNTRFIVGLPYDEMLREVSHLSPNTIVIISFVFMDGTGLPRVPPDVAAAVADVSTAPVYSPASTFFGQGIVGGYMDSFEAHGVAAADLALEVLSGRAPAALNQYTKPVHQYQVDARQFERWGLSAKNLPPDTVVSFRAPTLWEQHHVLILAAGLVFALQTSLVGVLLVQRRRNRLAENLLRESEERMTFTAASANIGLWQFDQKTDELWATEHCRSLFGLASDVPLTRKTFMTAIHPEDHEIAISLLRASPNADRSAVTDVRVVRPNNQARWIRILARSRPDNRDAPNQSSGIFVDITEQKTAEGEATLHRQKVAHLKRAGERAARLMTMHAMSASIAHEISQPLGAMVANSDAALLWLAEIPPNVNKARTSVERVASDGHRASNVITSLRGLYRKNASEKAPLDVNKLIVEVLAIEREELQNNRISVKLDLAGVIALVFADRLQLQQVILNLIVNAVGAMSSVTGRQRELRVTSAIHESGDVLISIEDSGTGIDREKMDTIFEPFFTTKSSGMGLGLWICRTIIESHNGRLTASPGIDHGTVFQVALPGGNAAGESQGALESFG